MKRFRHILVNVDLQLLQLIDSNGTCLISFPVSTSSRGLGCEAGSHKTPTGNFRIHRKIGAGEPIGTVFSARKPVGIWNSSPGKVEADDLILTRILQLDGLDPENSNTLERFIYFHGTNHEELIGQPASHGCIRLRNDDLLMLFDLISEGDHVIISDGVDD